MATFGLNQRQLEKDVNAGRVQPPLSKAVTPQGNVHAQSKRVVIGDERNEFGNLANTLMKGIGAIAENNLRQETKLDVLDGVFLAEKKNGLEQARAEEPVMNAIFGIPSAKLRTVEEQISSNTVKSAIVDLDGYIKETGYTQSPNDFRMYADEQIRAILEPFKDDPVMTTKILEDATPRLSKSMAEQAKANAQYNIIRQRNTDIKTLLDDSRGVKVDLASKDPARMNGAYDQLNKSLQQFEKYTPDKRASLILDAIGNETEMDGNAIVQEATKLGYLDNLTADQQNRINDYYLVYAKRNSDLYRYTKNQAARHADAGNLPELEKTLNYSDQKFPGGLDQNALMDTAEYNAETVRIEKQAISIANAGFGNGDKDWQKMDYAAKKSLEKRNGKEDFMIASLGMQQYYDENIDIEIRKTLDDSEKELPINRQQRQEFFNKHMLMFSDVWSEGNAKSPMMTNAINSLQTSLRDPALDEAGLRTLKDQLEQFGKTREKNGYLMQQQYSNPKQAAFMEDMYKRIYLEGDNPSTVIAQTLAAEQRNQLVGEPVPIEPEEFADILEDMQDAVRKDLGDGVWSRLTGDIEQQGDLNAALTSLFNEEYARTHDVKSAMYSAVNRLQSRGRIVNDTFLHNGAILEKRMNGDIEGTLKRVFGNERILQQLVKDRNFSTGTTGEEAGTVDTNVFSKDISSLNIFPDPRSNDVFIYQVHANGDKSDTIRLTDLHTLIEPAPEKDVVETVNDISERVSNFSKNAMHGWNDSPLQRASTVKSEELEAMQGQLDKLK